MSCRIAVNMTKRAAAGAISASVWLEEEALAPLHIDPPRLSRSNKTQIVGYQRTARTLMAFSVIAALSLVSYATYAHQWSEISALRHLGQTAPGKKVPSSLSSLSTLALPGVCLRRRGNLPPHA